MQPVLEKIVNLKWHIRVGCQLQCTLGLPWNQFSLCLLAPLWWEFKIKPTYLAEDSSLLCTLDANSILNSRPSKILVRWRAIFFLSLFRTHLLFSCYFCSMNLLEILRVVLKSKATKVVKAKNEIQFCTKLTVFPLSKCYLATLMTVVGSSRCIDF